jgi:hypothetical protein
MDPGLARDRRGAATLLTGQDDPGAHHVTMGSSSGPNSPLQFGASVLVQRELDA